MNKARRLEREFERRWGDLAQYNTEIARGLLHDYETDRRMRAKQQEYNEWVRNGMPEEEQR